MNPGQLHQWLVYHSVVLERPARTSAGLMGVRLPSTATPPVDKIFNGVNRQVEHVVNMIGQQVEGGLWTMYWRGDGL